MLVHRRVTPSIKLAGTHLYTWVRGDTVREECLVQEGKGLPGFEPKTLDPESSVLTMRLPRLQYKREPTSKVYHEGINGLTKTITISTVISTPSLEILIPSVPAPRLAYRE